MIPDIAIYETEPYTVMEEKMQPYSSAQIAILKYLLPVELNPLNEKRDFLNQLKNIQDNWDGYEGKAPNANTIRNAINFLSLLPAGYQKMLNLDDVAITPYGTVLMEWHKNDANYISIEIGSSKIGFLSETTDGENPYLESAEFNSNEIPAEVLAVLNKIFSQN